MLLWVAFLLHLFIMVYSHSQGVSLMMFRGIACMSNYATYLVQHVLFPYVMSEIRKHLLFYVLLSLFIYWYASAFLSSWKTWEALVQYLTGSLYRPHPLYYVMSVVNYRCGRSCPCLSFSHVMHQHHVNIKMHLSFFFVELGMIKLLALLCIS